MAEAFESRAIAKKDHPHKKERGARGDPELV